MNIQWQVIAWRELARARPVQQLDKTNVEAA
jgi:hypothetical protein